MGGLYGPATYLAEEATKSDQYSTPDYAYEQDGLEDLHSRLFRAGGASYPGGNGVEGSAEDLFYCLLVRTTLGWYQRTLDGKTNLDCPGQAVWHNMTEKRALSEVPDTDPPLRYHSLIAQVGQMIRRFREFMIYDGDQC